MSTYVFPGQGSQCIGMGDNLFDEFRDITKKADAILGYSIESLCKEDPHQLLNNIQYTQPALYVVNTLKFYKIIRDTQQVPQFVAGHSLGEYNALLAAEVFVEIGAGNILTSLIKNIKMNYKSIGTSA